MGGTARYALLVCHARRGRARDGRNAYVYRTEYETRDVEYRAMAASIAPRNIKPGRGSRTTQLTVTCNRAGEVSCPLRPD